MPYKGNDLREKMMWDVDEENVLYWTGYLAKTGDHIALRDINHNFITLAYYWLSKLCWSMTLADS